MNVIVFEPFSLLETEPKNPNFFEFSENLGVIFATIPQFPDLQFSELLEEPLLYKCTKFRSDILLSG